MPQNYKQLLAAFERLPDEVRNFLSELPELIDDYEWTVSVAYLFAKIDLVKHRTLYCGIVKLHNTDAALTRDLVDKDHMSRGRFRELFKVVYGEAIPAPLLSKLSTAETLRDRVVHGKKVIAADVRSGMLSAFHFAEEFNALVHKSAGFKPFGDLRGFKGSRVALSKDTTKWILRGMGIPASVRSE